MNYLLRQFREKKSFNLPPGNSQRLADFASRMMAKIGRYFSGCKRCLFKAFTRGNLKSYCQFLNLSPLLLFEQSLLYDSG